MSAGKLRTRMSFRTPREEALWATVQSTRGTEIWKDVPGYIGYYQVSNLGKVRSVDRVVTHSRYGSIQKKGMQIKPYLRKKHPGDNGYFQVELRGETNKLFRVHQLVLLAFIGPCPQGKQGRHLDGDSHNNVLYNLKYGTPLQNHADKIKHGTSGKGSSNPKAKLNEKTVLKIRKDIKILRGTPVTQIMRVLSDKYEISGSTICDVYYGYTWNHI